MKHITELSKAESTDLVTRLSREVAELRAEMVRMGRDHSVRLQVRDEVEAELRATNSALRARLADFLDI